MDKSYVYEGFCSLRRTKPVDEATISNATISICVLFENTDSIINNISDEFFQYWRNIYKKLNISDIKIICNPTKTEVIKNIFDKISKVEMPFKINTEFMLEKHTRDELMDYMVTIAESNWIYFIDKNDLISIETVHKILPALSGKNHPVYFCNDNKDQMFVNKFLYRTLGGNEQQRYRGKD